MCGIVGIWDFKNKINKNLLLDMRDSMYHRGPDSSGAFFSDNLALGHRRLSIIDTSDLGNQPMEKGDFVIVYNGEIYNFEEIRDELKKEGVLFESNSDTEVLLWSYIKWGKEAVHKFRGMFVFAIWDKKQKRLVLCRDRFGVKPLYYYFKDDLFVFASEIKAITKHPKIKKNISFEAISYFLKLGYIPAPLSIFDDIKKLEPGNFLEINQYKESIKEKYWDVTNCYSDPSHIDSFNEEEIGRILEDRLIDSFNLRMVSDVPVGVFLSGGIDSSIVTALLQRKLGNINTFTVGFENNAYNESHYAKEVASFLKTNHHEIICTSKDAMDVIPKIPEIYDEPFGDPSAIPTYLVSEFAKSKVGVALSADGGDEIFGGYRKYSIINNFLDKTNNIPQFCMYPFSFLRKSPSVFYKTKKIGDVFSQRGELKGIYGTLMEFYSDDEIAQLLKNKDDNVNFNLWNHFSGLENLDNLTQMQIVDFKTYLPDNILVKGDRASMASSLELREPFLDHEILKFAGSLPLDFKIRKGQSKYILKKILYKYVPQKLVDRPKQGFNVPIEEWLKGDLKYLVAKYLDENKIKREGLFDEKIVNREKQMFFSSNKFFSGKNYYFRIWRLLVFQMWKDYWRL